MVNFGVSQAIQQVKVIAEQTSRDIVDHEHTSINRDNSCVIIYRQYLYEKLLHIPFSHLTSKGRESA